MPPLKKDNYYMDLYAIVDKPEKKGAGFKCFMQQFYASIQKLEQQLSGTKILFALINIKLYYLTY